MPAKPSNDWEITSIQLGELPLVPGNALRALFIEKTTLIPPGEESGDDVAKRLAEDEGIGQ